MSFGAILLLCIASYAVLRIGRRVAFGRSSSPIRPLTVLGVAAIIGGLAVFGGRGANHVTYVRADRGSPAEEHVIDDVFSAHEQSPTSWQSELDGLSINLGHKQVSARKWVLISLGTVLVITGALLAGRGRARPVAFKAFTVLGLAAASFALVTFFTSAPRNTWGTGDRIVKNNHTLTIGDDSRSDEEPPPVVPHKKPKRGHAKRPASRAEHHESAEALMAKIPLRAGEIPVADELAKDAIKTAPASLTVTPLSPAAAESAPIPAAEPPKSTEPAVALEAAKAPEQPKPAESAPAPKPAKTREPARASEPVQDPTPETPSEPAAAPVPPPAAAVSKPAAKVGLPVKPTVSAPIQSTAERPAWVDQSGKLVDSVYRVSVNSELYKSVPECQRALDLQMKHAADQYIDDYLGDGASNVVDISLGYLRQHVKKAEFNEVINSETVGPMQQIHALLEFDDGARADFQRRWRAAVVGRRLWRVGAGTGLILSLLATFYGYLRLDLRTGGAHKGQLQLAAALVALIVTAGALLVQSKLPF